MNTSGKTILLAGGAGYLGSHAAVELLKAGHRYDLSKSRAMHFNQLMLL